MRSWENRPDTTVVDEPLYAHYLKTTGRQHPMADEIIAHDESDWRRVVEWLTGEIPGGHAVWYQKHMSHHLLPDIDRGWLARMTNCFLIRDPREMITSLIKIVPDAKLEDTGLPQQAEIFSLIRTQTGNTPPILDSKDVLTDPRRLLGLLCDALGLDFTDDMLSWPAGPRDTDGVWAPHWYASVWESTGFKPYQRKDEEVPPEFVSLYNECQPYYEQLFEHRLR